MARTAGWVASVRMRWGVVVQRPFLGIGARGEELAGQEARTAGTSRAVRVLEVRQGTPAEEAGLAPNDLLLSADDNPILTLDDLQRVMVLASLPEIRLVVLRQGAQRTLSIRPRPLARAA